VSDLFLAAVLLLVAGIPLGLARPRLGTAATAVGLLLVCAVGVVSAGAWSHASVSVGSWLGFGPASLVSDRLAGIFLAVIGAAGGAVSLALVERPEARVATALHSLLALTLVAVVGADQGFLFLLAWEVLTLTLYLLAGLDRERPGTLLAAYFSGSMSKLGGGALLAAFALLYARTGSFEFHDWAAAAPQLAGGVRAAVFLLLLIGFGTKVGMLPFQGPLPLGYAATPGAVAALVSLALNAGFYGLWRLVFGVLAAGALWQGELVLMLGAVGGLVGILYAIGQDDLKRFLGFSSVEHAGIVLLGFGVAIVGRATGEPKLAAAGLLAATLHLVMHALAKTLAFLGADRVGTAAGTWDLAPLGGLAHPLPRTTAGFGVAVVTLAALPPFAGFVSEWFTLEALLQAFRLDDTVARLLLALGAALLALTAGLGLLAFAKLFGTVFLGQTRSLLGRLHEAPGPALGFAGLALLTVALGVLSPWEIRWLGHGLQELLGFDLAGTTITHPLVLGPVYGHFSVLAPTWLAVAVPAYAIATGLLVALLLRPPVRRAPAWTSGALVAPSRVQYTPAGYSNPIRVVLRPAYGFRRRLEPSGGGPRAPERLALETRVVPFFEHYLYLPLAAVALRASQQARRLQSGRLSMYLLYMLVVLLVVLALIPALRS
jgi:formate hydrogenlyase subunit 3/multisubunit Na+/H+ antiporter MnhD subunit